MRDIAVKLTLIEAEFLVDLVNSAYQNGEYNVHNEKRIEALLDKLQTAIEVS